MLLKVGSEGEENDEKILVEKYVDLETKLASCLQHHRLAAFKPRILALALISLEFEKQQSEMKNDWLDSITHLQQLAKVCQEIDLFFFSILKFRLKVMLYYHVEI